MRARLSSKRTHSTRREASPKLVVLKVLGNTTMRVTQAGRARTRRVGFWIELWQICDICRLAGESVEETNKILRTRVALTLLGLDPSNPTLETERDLAAFKQFRDSNTEIEQPIKQMLEIFDDEAVN